MIRSNQHTRALNHSHLDDLVLKLRTPSSNQSKIVFRIIQRGPSTSNTTYFALYFDAAKSEGMHPCDNAAALLLLRLPTNPEQNRTLMCDDYDVEEGESLFLHYTLIAQ